MTQETPSPEAQQRVKARSSLWCKGLMALVLAGGMLLLGAWAMAEGLTAPPAPQASAPQLAVSPTPYYYLDPPLLELPPGGTGQVTIRTSAVEGLGGVEVHLRWDPALVEVLDTDLATPGVQIEPGNLFLGYATYRPPHGNEANNAAGTLIYALSLTGEQVGVNGAWSVARITFHAKSSGTTVLAFYGDTLMANPQTGDIPCGWVDGQVRVLEPTPTPTDTPTITPTPSPTDTPTPVPTVPTPTPTATPSCCHILENGSFEERTDGQAPPWFLAAYASLTDRFAFDGSWSIWLGGYDNATDGVSQAFTLPAGLSTATLSYAWYVETTETDHPHDFFYVELRRPTGELVATLATHDDGGQPGIWHRASVDLLPYAGQTLVLHFRMAGDATNFSSFFLDDVQIEICTGVSPTPTVTPSPTGPQPVCIPLVMKEFVKAPEPSGPALE
jgi:hypothetical protein